jgi:hypothetical protein
MDHEEVLAIPATLQQKVVPSGILLDFQILGKKLLAV